MYGTRYSRRLSSGFVTATLSLILGAQFASAQALVPTLTGPPTPSGGNFLFNYTINVDASGRADSDPTFGATCPGPSNTIVQCNPPGTFVTIYDIPGLVGANVSAPGWSSSIQLVGVTPSSIDASAYDSPVITNVTFMYVGPAVPGPVSFPGFTIISSFGGTQTGNFSSQNTRNSDSLTQQTAGQVVVPALLAMPTLAVNPTQLSFAYQTGMPFPQVQKLTATSASMIAYSVMVSTNTGGNWLFAGPPNGTINSGSPATVNVQVNPGGLPPGNYQGQIAIAGAGANTVIIPVSLLVTQGPPPLIITTPSQLPAGTVGAQYSQAFATIGGTLPISFVAFGNVPPLLAFFAKGVMSGIPLQAGIYNFVVEADDAAGQSDQKNFTVTINPALAISPPSLPGGGVGLPYSQKFSVTGGTLPIAFSYYGQLPPGLTLSQAGVLSGKPTAGGVFAFTVVATDAAKAVAIQAYQVAIEAAPVQVFPPAINLEGPAFGSVLPPLAITVSTGLDPSKSFTISVLAGGCGNPFTPLVALSGTTPAVLTITADPDSLPPGVYCAIVRIIAAGFPLHPVDIPITLTLRSTAPAAGVAPGALQFTATPARTGPFSGALTVRNTGGGRQEFSATRADNAAWLISVSQGGVAGPNSPGLVAVKVDATGLAPGFYRSGVLIVFGNTKQIIPVLLYVSPDTAALGVDKRGVRFKSRPGSAGAFTQTVTVLDVGDANSSIDWTADVSYDAAQGAAVGVHWVNLGARSGTAQPGNGSPLAISLSPEAAGLPPGLYTAIVKISPPDAARAPQFVTVLLEQTDPSVAPEPELSPGGMFFKTKASAGLTPAQTLNVFATIDPPFQVSTQTFNNSGNWLLVSPQSGNAAAAVATQLSVQVNPAGLAPGVYRGEVDIELGGNIRGAHVTLVVLRETQVESGQVARPLDDAPTVPCGSQLAITLMSPVSHFFTTAGFPETVTAMVTDDCGNSMPGASVSASFSTGDDPLTLSGSSPDGVYASTWVPTHFTDAMAITVDASFVVSPDTILRKTEQFTGSVAQPGTVGPPLVTNINGNSLDPVAVGTTSTIAGARLYVSNNPFDAQFNTGRLNGTSVLVAGGTPLAALLGVVSDTSVIFQVPAVTGPRIFPVIVSANGLSSAQVLFLRVQ